MPSASQTAAPAGAFPAARGTVTLLVLTALVVLTQLYAAIPLLAPVGEQLGADPTVALTTAFGLCYAAGFLVWGPVSDQVGRRRVLVIGLSLLTVTTFACAAASTIPVLAVLRGLQGFTAASFAPAALAYLSEAIPPARRPGAIGAMSVAFLVAGIFGQVLGSLVALHLGWPWLFAGCGITLAAAVAATARIPAEPVRDGESGHLGQRFAAVGRVVAKPAVLLLCAAHVTLLMSFVGLYTALGPHLETLGLDASQVIWVRLAGLPGMFAALLSGPLSRRLGMAGVARTGYLIAAAGVAAAALLASSLAGVGAASLVFVTGVALAVPAMITLFGESAAPNRAGGMALNGFVLFLGASVGPLASSAAAAFPMLLSAFAALLAGAALCVTLFGRRSTPAGPRT